MSDAEEKNKALVRHFFDAQTKGDLAAVEEMMTLDFVNHHRGSGQERSREGYLREAAEDRAACSDLRYIIEDQAADGDRVLSRFTIRGMHDRGEWRGFAPTGMEFEARKQRSGHVISISSTAGFVGIEYCSAYVTSKFGLEGWMKSLQPEVAPFGINTTIVNPGFFRTELLRPESRTWVELFIDDYAERNAAQREWWEGQNGQQGGDPAKLAQALLTIASEEQPPRRFIAGADAIAVAEQKVADLQQQINAYRDLSTSLALDDVEAAGNRR